MDRIIYRDSIANRRSFILLNSLASARTPSPCWYSRQWPGKLCSGLVGGKPGLGRGSRSLTVQDVSAALGLVATKLHNFLKSSARAKAHCSVSLEKSKLRDYGELYPDETAGSVQKWHPGS